MKKKHFCRIDTANADEARRNCPLPAFCFLLVRRAKKRSVTMQIWKWKQYLKKEGIVQQIPIIKIRSNPYQPRRYFQRNALEELAASIRTYGILQPLRLRPMNAGYYELITGERRYRRQNWQGWKRCRHSFKMSANVTARCMYFWKIYSGNLLAVWKKQRGTIV